MTKRKSTREDTARVCCYCCCCCLKLEPGRNAKRLVIGLLDMKQYNDVPRKKCWCWCLPAGYMISYTKDTIAKIARHVGIVFVVPQRGSAAQRSRSWQIEILGINKLVRGWKCFALCKENHISYSHRPETMRYFTFLFPL